MPPRRGPCRRAPRPPRRRTRRLPRRRASRRRGRRCSWSWWGSPASVDRLRAPPGRSLRRNGVHGRARNGVHRSKVWLDALSALTRSDTVAHLMGMSERRRVAILGGGAGSLAAAFELTATPELRERYTVTVYQLGWRLGGKGASGRRRTGAEAQRIEEHGLHVWFGFYENAFDVIRRVYEELDRPADAPLRTWRDAFHPTNEVVLCDDTEDDCWIPRHFEFPGNDGVPGIPTDPPGLHRLM